MKLYVGVTDKNWFEFLRARPELDEVNFCSRAGLASSPFCSPVTRFFSKLRQPDNFIVGGGMFAFRRAAARSACTFEVTEPLLGRQVEHL
jgi:putative restriction endonuclease